MANKKMIKGARILLECLSRLGINEIFGYPGGAVIPMLGQLVKLVFALQHLDQELQTW